MALGHPKGHNCDACKQARLEYKRQYRARRMAARTPVGTHRVNDTPLPAVERVDHLKVTCWCEAQIVTVSTDWVRRGLTHSCGRDTCTATTTAPKAA